MTAIFDTTVRLVTGEKVPLSCWRGVALVVNVASRCGFTPQYEGLQDLQDRFGHRGFNVLAFPCNQFGAQEPGSNAEILDFCRSHYDVTFPVFARIEVNGPGADPLFQALVKEAPGVFGTRRIKWNFTKFLLGADGTVKGRFGPMTKPERLAKRIDALLQEASLQEAAA